MFVQPSSLFFECLPIQLSASGPVTFVVGVAVALLLLAVAYRITWR